MKFFISAWALWNTIAAVYVLDPLDNYSGPSFFNMFDFRTENDPTGGFVDYLTQATAIQRGLIGYNPTQNRVYIGVDNKNVLGTFQTSANRGRASVRLQSKKAYTHGLFIADFLHVPQQACGIWPAFWTYSSQDYPRWGEIDIFESINENQFSLNVLHTGPGCTLAGNQGGTRMTGNMYSYNCDDRATMGPFETPQSINEGCASIGSGHYGSAFNANGGGIVTMEWTDSFIRMWNFGPSNTPLNIRSSNPDTSTWGVPDFTTEGGGCPINDHFKAHNIIIDITFCGFYAGQAYFWEQTSCFKSDPGRYPRCLDYVAANPGAFENAYWVVNSIKVYQWT
ncbi:putative endo-1,3(4)-beta-glucanase [Calycina marina]|uniref:Endo-1,3(4)-beta-glucanase n=1 Tax=Calycina marina TaxID=1763456 RepID=A0A9P7YUE2_9HELO|nr:putative endo-1,3(4)-beta-glucanase [Calycina marina]